MTFKKLLTALILTAVIPVCAHAEITDVKPTQNIGVFNYGEHASFVITKDTDVSEVFSYTAENMNGEIVLSGTVTAKGTEFTLDLGTLKSGWYRIRIYDGSKNEVNPFTSCTILPATGKTAEDSPLSGMFVGVWNGTYKDKKDEYTDAFARAGVDTVRDSMLWCKYDYDYNVFDGTISAIHDAGSKPLLTVDVQDNYLADNGYGMNLYDVYYQHKVRLGDYYKDKAGAWDIVNEPDIISGLAADTYASYFKAAAIGIRTASPESEVSFGGMCAPTLTFEQIMLQNRVLDYATYYNVHSHTSAKGTSYQAFPSSLLTRGRNWAALYGDNQPLWVTEAGMNMAVDSNELPSTANLREQALYLTTSFAESIGEYGTQNHVWFILRHYLENGWEWGTTSKNHMTYPAWLALANLTYNLGEAKPLGEFSLADGVVGYVFDTGDGNDAAVIWKKTAGTSYVQLLCDVQVKIMGALGDTEWKPVIPESGRVNFAVTSEPVIVRFCGKCPTENYAKKSFPEYEKTELSDGDHIVLQQDWSSTKTKETARVLDAGEEYTVKCKVYNFGSNTANGSLKIAASEDIVIEEEPLSTSYSVPAYSGTGTAYAEFTYIIKVKSDIADGATGNLMFSADGITPSVAGYTVNGAVNYDASTFAELSNAYKLSSYTRKDWGTAMKEKYLLPMPSSYVHMKVSFDGGNRFAFPYFDTTVPATSEGITFDAQFDKTGDGGNVMVYLVTADGGYRTTAGAIKDGTTNYVIPWSRFDSTGTNEPLDITKIKKISIGVSASGDSEIDLYLKNIGTFGNAYVAEEKNVELTGIKSGEIYTRGNLPITTAVCADTADIYVNYEKFATVTNGERVDLSDLPAGATSVMAAVTDEFGKVEYAEYSIFIKEYNDYSGNASFY